MSLSAVPLSWAAPRLEYELMVVSDELNMELVALRDSPLSTVARSMHQHVLQKLTARKLVIEERLGLCEGELAC